MPTAQVLRIFAKVGWDALEGWLRALRPVQPSLAPTSSPPGSSYLGYLYSYRRLTEQGYRPCPQKIAMLGSSGSVSIVAWGFLTPWKAFFVTNFFHCWQRFAIVWWTERRTLRRLLTSSTSAPARGSRSSPSRRRPFWSDRIPALRRGLCRAPLGGGRGALDLTPLTTGTTASSRSVRKLLQAPGLPE